MRDFITTRSVLLTVDSQDYYIDVQRKISDIDKGVTQGPIYNLNKCGGCIYGNPSGSTQEARKSILDFDTVMDFSTGATDLNQFKKIHNNKGSIIQVKKESSNYNYYTSDNLNFNTGNSINFILNKDTSNDKFTKTSWTNADKSYFIMDGNIIYEEDIIKIPIYNYDLIQKINSTSNIEIKVNNNITFKFNNENNETTQRKLRKTKVKVLKTINNFEEFDASIFGT